MKKIIIAIIVLALALLIPVYGRLTSQIAGKPLEEKLGYIPQREFLRPAAMDHKALVSEWIFLKVLIYFGGRADIETPEARKNTEYYNMYRLLDASTYIDPYNIDSYYFAQAVFTWELGKIKEVNSLLERGVQYRTWDFYLPFFLGFNHFYFLKDPKSASQYMEKAARITGDPLFTNLAARLYYESNETAAAISFLNFMIENTWNQQVKQILDTRLKALLAFDLLEKGLKKYELIYHHRPGSIEDLVNSSVITKVPRDPYGGKFYIDERGKVRASSNLAFSVDVKE